MRLVLLSVTLALLINQAEAEEPSKDCARNFVGSWRHQGFMETNMEELTPNGRAICSGNPSCTAGGAWSCTGNVLHYSNSAGSWDYILQPGGATMQGPGGNVATRVSAPPPEPKHRPSSIPGCDGGVTRWDSLEGDVTCINVHNQCGRTISVKLGITSQPRYQGSADVQPSTLFKQCAVLPTWKYVFKGFTIR
jgi:hypothetical protein